MDVNAVPFSTTSLWSIDLSGVINSSMTSSISFVEFNGTYNYTAYAPTKAQTGCFVEKTVNDMFFVVLWPVTLIVPLMGESLKIVARYTVTFVETGLSSFILWSIDLSGVINSSMTSSISFVEFNGTYNYSVLSVTGYSSSKSGGTVTLNQNNVTVNIVFTSLTPPNPEYTVYFNETGLQSGTTWEVVLNGTALTSTSSSIQFRT